MARPDMAAFQRRVAEIEQLFADREIGPETRRALLERARDQHGVGKGEFVNGMPSRPANSNVTPRPARHTR